MAGGNWAVPLSVAGLSVAGLTLTGTAAAAQQPATAVEEVVVTASKREERLQDAPLAITALGRERLQTLGVSTFTDYISLVPNLAQAGGVAPGAGNVILRGLYTGPESRSTTTAFYLGESPFTPSGGFGLGSLQTPDPDLVDVERIEVLKGPQGTLYGASSLGGLVRIIPRQPNVDATGMRGSLRVSGRATEGGDTGHGLRASADGALVPGRFALGLSGFTRKDPGFIKNVRNGHDGLGATDAYGAVMTAVARPVDGLELSLRGLLQDTETVGQLAQWNVAGTRRSISGKRTISSYIDEGAETHYELFEAVGRHQSRFGLLTAVASYGSTELQRTNDYTASYGRFIGATAANGYGVRGVSNPSSELENYELRFASARRGRLEFLLGAFATNQDHDYTVALYGETASGAPLPGAAAEIITQHSLVSFKERALFGNLTIYVTDQLDLTGGVRYSDNTQRGTTKATGLLGRPVSAPPTTHDSHDNSTVYQFTLRWRPTENVSAYARAASGYRPGGPENGPTAPTPFYLPDRVWNYELGIKGAALDRRLRFDASAYFIDWQDVQLNGRAGGFIYTGNGGGAEVKGVEVQASFAATPQLVFGMAGGYNDAKLTEVGTATASALGALDGDRLPGSAKWSGSLYGDYDFPIGGKLTGAVGATVRYQGDRVSSYTNDVLNTKVTIPSYATLDLRGSVSWDRYTARLSVENVTDETGINGYNTLRVLAGQAVHSYAYLIRPRTVTLSLAVEF